MVPFVPRAVSDGDATDCDFADVVWQCQLGANGADEAVPAVCEGRGVQECQVERLEGSWMSSLTDSIETAAASVLENLLGSAGSTYGRRMLTLWDECYGIKANAVDEVGYLCCSNHWHGVIW